MGRLTEHAEQRSEKVADADQALEQAARLYGDKLTRNSEQILDDLRPFLYDRIRYLLGLAGYAYDEIEAALAVGVSSLPDLRARVDALHRMRESPDFLSVILAAKRAREINSYYTQLGEGRAEFVPPLVESGLRSKPLSIALEEIGEGKILADRPEGVGIK